MKHIYTIHHIGHHSIIFPPERYVTNGEVKRHPIFENNVSILFRAEGVWSLLSDQNGELLNSKTYSKVLSALPTYEIDNLYFCEDSVNERQINRDQIDIPVKPLSLNEQQQLIANQDIVMAGPK